MLVKLGSWCFLLVGARENKKLVLSASCSFQNNEEVVRINLSVLLVIRSFICNKGGREVLGRTVVLRGSSGCLNTWIFSFHLVAARKTRVAGWCKGEQLFSFIQVGACVTGSWCFHLVGIETLRELVLPSSGF